MKTLKPIAMGIASTLLFGNFVFASTVNQRERNQQRRIAHGVRDGELTRNEARKLEKEQAKIRRDEARAKADGDFTPKERAKIQREQDRASRDIYKETHDNQSR